MNAPAGLWYMAHPLRKPSLAENLTLAGKRGRILLAAGFSVYTPWAGTLLMLDDGDEQQRTAGMELNRRILPRFNGIILTGERLSEGMKTEHEIALYYRLRVIDLVGIPDSSLAKRALDDYNVLRSLRDSSAGDVN